MYLLNAYNEDKQSIWRGIGNFVFPVSEFKTFYFVMLHAIRW
jgi:hypothetical protein